MSLVSLLAIYFVVWWIVLFAVLPWGVRTQDEEGDVTLGTAHSAPTRPLLIRKAIATSIMAAILVAGFWVAVEYCGLSLEAIANAFDLRQ